MSKGNSGYFHGTNGKGGGLTPPLFNNGHVTYEGIKAHREAFMNKSVEQIAEMLKDNGYEIRIRRSNHADSTAKIIEITNASKAQHVE